MSTAEHYLEYFRISRPSHSVVSKVDVGLLSPAGVVAEDEKNRVPSRAVEFKTGIFFVHRSVSLRPFRVRLL